MKRKVKKYAGEDESLVKGSTNLRTRSDAEFDEDNKFGGYGRYMPKTKSISIGRKSSDSEDRPTTSGVEDYESLGKRAPAKSTMSGPIEYITDSSKENAYKETESDEPRRKITDYSTNKGTTTYLQKEDAPSTVSKTKIKKPVVKKVDTPDESAAETARLKRQADSARKKALEESDKPLESVNPESYFPPLRGLSALAKGLASKKAIEEVGKRAGSEISAFAKKTGDSLSSFVRTPKNVIRQAEKDITPRAPRLGNEPPKLGMKKGGAVKKMASGGKTSSASSRGDGIAQRGKTRGRMR
jgi:hypothetical protein